MFTLKFDCCISLDYNFFVAIWGPNEPTNFDNETHVVITTKLTNSSNNFLLSDVIGASHTGLAFCQYSE